jgi:hypothetical protein
VARAAFVPPRRGQINIRAESEPAFTSITLQITIQEESTVVVTIQPTVLVSDTPAPTATAPPPTPTPEPPTATPTATEDLSTPPVSPTPTDFLALLGGLAVFGLVGLRLGQGLPAGRGRRLGLFAALGALVGYNYYALHLPGAAALGDALPLWGATVITWIGGVAGLGLGWLRYGRARAFPSSATGPRT